MTEAQKKKELKQLAAKLAQIHAEYLERFSKLKKRQLALLKAVAARSETARIGRLVKDINKKGKK